VIRRRADYQDRRGKEYVEPVEIYIVATAHTSTASAEAATRVIEEVGDVVLCATVQSSRGGD
jgi:pheromone shutdown protein TraB